MSTTARQNGKHPGGRPTKYKPDYTEQAYKFCLLGATDEKLAAFFGVDVATIYRWKDEIPEFREALKNGKERADAEIAQALYHRAKGYSHDAVKILTVADGGNSGSHVESVPYVEHYPPDTAAAFIWLKNRAGWKDKQEVKHEGLEGLFGFLRNSSGDGNLTDPG